MKKIANHFLRKTRATKSFAELKFQVSWLNFQTIVKYFRTAALNTCPNLFRRD